MVVAISVGAAIREGTSWLDSILIDYFADFDSRADFSNGDFCCERFLFEALVESLCDIDFGANGLCCARA